ncbi:MAG: MurR/RpiR family transcriptional regulator [Chloroflexi bacterium]|nr:MurR/RpiR family transcriptional regulator [Chloroflexota bacterium]
MEPTLDRFLRNLEDRLPNLTKSQQRIALYLLANYDEAAFLSARDLVTTLQVSEATLTRFARAIGYSGFRELRRALQELFRARATPASRLQRKLSELSSNPVPVLTQVLEMEVQYLTEASSEIAHADFGRAVELLLAGERVFTFASGPSAVLADLAELRLRRMGVLTIAMTESGRHLLEKLQLLGPHDAVLACGFQYVSPELGAVLDHSRQVGCGSVLITDTLGPALRSRADVILAARRGPVSTFHSLTVPMAVLNALLLAIAMARPAESLAALEHLETLRATYVLDPGGEEASRRSRRERR